MSKSIGKPKFCSRCSGELTKQSISALIHKIKFQEKKLKGDSLFNPGFKVLIYEDASFEVLLTSVIWLTRLLS